jgi:AbrB family looped-hinge helix DNA binding protein
MLLKVNPRGQITLPKFIRSAMNLEFGDSILLTQRDDEIVLRMVPETLYDLRGSVPVDGVQDFNAVIEEAKQQMAEDAAR